MTSESQCVQNGAKELKHSLQTGWNWSQDCSAEVAWPCRLNASPVSSTKSIFWCSTIQLQNLGRISRDLLTHIRPRSFGSLPIPINSNFCKLTYIDPKKGRLFKQKAEEFLGRVLSENYPGGASCFLLNCKWFLLSCLIRTVEINPDHEAETLLLKTFLGP